MSTTPSDELLCCASPLATPSDALMALLPDEDTIRELLIQVRDKAYREGYTLGRSEQECAVANARAAVRRVSELRERDSATTYGAGYDSGYQDGVRATRQAGP